MEAKKIALLDQEFLTPKVFILTENLSDFASYTSSIQESGYVSEVFSESQKLLSAISETQGGIVFLSWNYTKNDISALFEIISGKLKSECIIFSETDNIQSTAQLVSKKFPSIIQTPHNPKNFIMAIQKVVSDRHELNERMKRKIEHQERMQFFSHHPDPKDFDLIEKRNLNADNSSHTFSDDREATLSKLEKNEQTKTHLSIVKNEEPKSPVLHQKGVCGAINLYQPSKTTEQPKKLLFNEPTQENPVSTHLKNPLRKKEELSLAKSLISKSPEQLWQELSLPLVPEILKSNIPPVKVARETLITVVDSDSQFTERDWVLILLGIILGGLSCIYLLAHVFIFPYLMR